MHEFFVSPEEAAEHLSVTKRYLLDLARAGRIPGHPLPSGRKRRQWRFRLSELDQAMASRTLVVGNANELNCSFAVRLGNARSRSQR